MVSFRNNAQYPHGWRGVAVAPWLSLHENVFDVILNYRIGLVWLAQKTRPILNLKLGIGDLMPNYGRKIIETDSPAPFLNACMEGYNSMPPMLLARKAD